MRPGSFTTSPDIHEHTADPFSGGRGTRAHRLKSPAARSAGARRPISLPRWRRPMTARLAWRIASSTRPRKPAPTRSSFRPISPMRSPHSTSRSASNSPSRTRPASPIGSGWSSPTSNGQVLPAHAREIGIGFLSSAFSHRAVELLERLGMPAWKIASGEVRFGRAARPHGGDRQADAHEHRHERLCRDRGDARQAAAGGCAGCGPAMHEPLSDLARGSRA